MIWIVTIIFFWFFCLCILWYWKAPLLKKTWQEPYFSDTPVLIESDDWGPGGDFHADRLEALLSILQRHKDNTARPAVLTADMVLSLPDTEKINSHNNGSYFRKSLDSFPEIYKAMQTGMQQGSFVPQLHGLEHLNGKAFAALMQQQDLRLNLTKTTSDWWDWEALDSPLQGHYVDGSTLPTTPIPTTEAVDIISTASLMFQQLFGSPSASTVAPCYLWNDEIEQLWAENNIQYIQTAGYRCTGRDVTGKYTQNPALIRVGDKNKYGLIYLVRNVMYEPVDGKNTAETAYQEALVAFKQALPISISTHRYNYTRSLDEHEKSLAGLDALLTNLTQHLANIRFLSSAELGAQLSNAKQAVLNPFNQSSWPAIKQLDGYTKLSAFLYRLYYRHPKLVLVSYFSGLIIPAWLICNIQNAKKLS